MIYPLQRPVEPVFNSAAAIRNTLTSGFEGDGKEGWKPLSVKTPSPLRHTHTHAHEHRSGTTVKKKKKNECGHLTPRVIANAFMFLFFSLFFHDLFQTGNSLCSF